MKMTLVSVYRCDTTIGKTTYDTTNNGVTSRHNDMYLFWDCDKSEAISYCESKKIDTDSALILVKRELWGEDHSYAAPLVRPDGKIGPMFGGNFIYTSDANFYKMHGLATATPIFVHDRFETQEEYNALSI